MTKNKIVLPSVISEDCWFYEANKEKLEPFLGVPYISYSSVSSWEEYDDSFIKEKLAKIKLPQGLYACLGNYLGEAVETGEFAEENPNGFTGQENFHLIERPENAKYERFILIDRGEYILIGFIENTSTVYIFYTQILVSFDLDVCFSIHKSKLHYLSNLCSYRFYNSLQEFHCENKYFYMNTTCRYKTFHLHLFCWVGFLF